MNDGLNELSLRLHSRYQPAVEADRYIGSLDISRDTGCFILIEPGLGYLIHPLQKNFPNGKIIVLHADSRFREAEHLGIPTWYPDSGISVQEFLENEIPDTASIRLIEWRPGIQLFGEPCLQLLRESTEFIKRAQAGRRTAAVFGKRWVRNFFRNISLVQKPLLYRQTEMPVIITGAGPSLEKALPQIRSAGDDVFIIAASSSLPALQAGGVTPDMVIGTDGGGWALTHLYSFFRPQKKNFTTEDTCLRDCTASSCVALTKATRQGPQGMLLSREKQACFSKRRGENTEKTIETPCCPQGQHSSVVNYSLLALSLCAAVPSQCSDFPVLLLNDGSLWQSIALNAVGLPSVTIPQRGTVTASALDLAMILTSGNIFLAGMDLSVNDIKSHARPNGFDYLFYGSASRLRPVYSQVFKRSSDIKSGGSLEIYAAWFKSRIAEWPDRIFSLGGNHEVFENSLPKKPLEKEERRSENWFKVISASGSVQGRVKQAAEALQASLNDSKFAATLTEELAPLLCPSNNNTVEIARILGEIAGDGGKGLG
jgi:hypothetical protein